MKTRWILPLPGPDRPEIDETSEFSLDGDESVRNARARIRILPMAMPSADPGGKLIMKGEISYDLATDCARCLQPATARVEAVFTSLINLEEGTISSQDLDTPPEPGGFTPVGDGEIDITKEVRQQVFLAAPATVLCSVNCRGLCPRCGANMNKNPCFCHNTSGSGHFDGLAGLLKNR